MDAAGPRELTLTVNVVTRGGWSAEGDAAGKSGGGNCSDSRAALCGDAAGMRRGTAGTGARVVEVLAVVVVVVVVVMVGGGWWVSSLSREVEVGGRRGFGWLGVGC